MKKWLIALIWLLVSAAALAEGDIVLDENRVLPGMERSWAQGYAPGVEGSAVVIHLPLICEAVHGKLKATLTLDDPSVTPFKDQEMTIAVQRNEDKVFPVKFRLKLLSDYQNGDYPCRIRVEGEGVSAMEMPLLLRVRGGGDGHAELRAEMDILPTQLRAGETSPLSLRIANPYPDVEMREAFLTVAEETGEVMGEGSEVIDVGALAPGASIEKTLSLNVLPSASVRPHTLKCTLTFTALDAVRTWEQSFNLPVIQPMRLEQGGLQMAASFIQGDTATLTLPLMNMGRGELKNVCATLTLPGLLDRQSVLVGAISSGETKQAKVSWNVPRDAQPGDYAGILSVTAEDEWGNATAFELPVPLTVEQRAAPAEENVRTAVLTAAADHRLTYALAAACALLLIALMVQGILLRGKIRRAEEGRL